MNIDGKRVLITGGSSETGLAPAQALPADAALFLAADATFAMGGELFVGGGFIDI